MEQPIVPGEPIVVRMGVFGESGEREMDAVLEMGASYVTIRPEDAIYLAYDLARAPRVTVATASGFVQAPELTLLRVVVGEHQEENVPALCLDLPAGAPSSLLGLSLLGRFRVRIDAKSNVLEIADP